MATDLRVQLFRQLLLLDMQFFDSQKTGELTSRLNGDVQEFKSSFKLTVAQGLKTIAQVLFITLSLVLLQFVDNRLCGVPDLYLAQTHPPHGFNRPRCRLLRSHFRCTASDAQQTVRSKKSKRMPIFAHFQRSGPVGNRGFSGRRGIWQHPSGQSLCHRGTGNKVRLFHDFL